MLNVAIPWLEQKIHPTQIIAGYMAALEDAMKICEELSFDLDMTTNDQLLTLIRASLGTKFVNRWSDKMCHMALDAVLCVREEVEDRINIDLKKYAKVEKVPGGEVEECRVIQGVMFNKDILHPQMRRKIENPRIILLDCNLEYKKPESDLSFEAEDEGAFEAMLKIEMAAVEEMVESIAKFKPDLVITEKGISGTYQK